MAKKRVVILGGGYGGLITSKKLAKVLQDGEAEVTLINKHDYHYISTQLHKTGAGTASDERITLSIPELIDPAKITFKKGTVTSMDFDNQEVILATGEAVVYDYLLIALGFEVSTFGIPGVKENAFAIRSFRSTKAIFHHIQHQLDAYSRDGDQSRLTFVVAGGGFTGVEMLGELVEALPKFCKQYHVPAEKVRIIGVEGAPSVLPYFDQQAIDYTTKFLKDHDVEVMTSTKITECTPTEIKLDSGEKIPTRTLIWSAGVRGNTILEKVGIDTRQGRVVIDKHLRIPNMPENVFCIGDCSMSMKDETTPYPPTAQIAIQQAQLCGENIAAALRGQELKEFEYHHKGSVASIGERAAVGKVGNFIISGRFAAFMKQVIEARYLFVLGGPGLVIKQFLKGKHAGSPSMTKSSTVD